MPLPALKKVRRTNSVISLKDCSLTLPGETVVAWWYSGFYKNRRDVSQPNVLVLFRKISAAGISDQVIQRRVPLVALGQVRVGTIWKNDRCETEARFDPKRFFVDFTPGKWRYTSFAEAIRKQVNLPYPQGIHQLLLEKDRNWLIEFDLPSGGKLLVPCIEFFSRCYGRSGELKRVLATYPWDGQGDTAVSRFYAPLEAPESPGRWQVRLRKRLHNGDVVLLAHAKYDNYTKRVVKSVHAQLEAKYDPKLVYPAFIQAGPWYRGPAELKVEGIAFDNEKSFLALRVLGMSDPGGSQIFRSRENCHDALNPAPEGSPEAWAGAPERVLVNKYPEIIDLTGDMEPDHDAGAVEIQDPEFEVLGDARAVIDVRAAQATTRGGAKGPASEVTAVSGGAAHGSGKGVGYAAIHAKPMFESNGILRDMWDAMLRLHATRPDVVQGVTWFTFADGFRNEPTPGLIAFEPFKDSDEVSSEVRRFPFMDPGLQSLRGILVARLITSDGAAYIVEIMRRPKKISADDGTVKSAEEAFQGLVFRLHNENQLIPWLRGLMALIRRETGVFKRLTGRCPGIAHSFSHRFSAQLGTDSLPCESIVLAALAKLGARD